MSERASSPTWIDGPARIIPAETYDNLRAFLEGLAWIPADSIADGAGPLYCTDCEASAGQLNEDGTCLQCWGTDEGTATEAANLLFDLGEIHRA